MPEYVKMPKALTEENGAKYLLSGEFFEEIDIENPEYCGCGKCDYCYDFPNEPEIITRKVPVQWRTIKKIYAMAVTHLAR